MHETPNRGTNTPMKNLPQIVTVVVIVITVAAGAYLLLDAAAGQPSKEPPRLPTRPVVKKDIPIAVPKPVTLNIPAGESGTLEYEGGARIEIPKGALSESVTVSISEVEPPSVELPEIVELGKVFDISIGQAELTMPITIHIPYEPQADTTAEDVLALHWDEDLEGWEVLEGEVDESRSEITVEVSELSWFSTIVRKAREIAGYDYTSEDASIESCRVSTESVGSNREFSAIAVIQNRSVDDNMYVEFIITDVTRGLEWKLESASSKMGAGETKEFRVSERLSPPGDKTIQCVLRVGLTGSEAMEVAFPSSLSDLNDLLSDWFGPELDRIVRVELQVDEFTESRRTEAQLSDMYRR